MQQLNSALTLFSSWALSITAIIGALALIFKPFRVVLKKLMRISQKDKELSDKIGELDKKLDKVKENINEAHADSIREIHSIEYELKQKINEVEEREKNDECDRLKDVIFKYGNYARKQSHISSEEFRYLQRTFQKYTDLGGNDIAHDEFDFIMDYYNHDQQRIE